MYVCIYIYIYIHTYICMYSYMYDIICMRFAVALWSIDELRVTLGFSGEYPSTLDRKVGSVIPRGGEV